jgi:uncharacterized protein (TIGR02145 family)
MVLRLCIFAAFLLFIACSEPSFDNPTDPYNISHPSNITYESFKDARDGQTYKSVVIGTQTWMADNLNYNASGSICVSYVEEYCDIYGRLYNWNTAMSVCPSGWHLPSSDEWGILLMNIVYVGEGGIFYIDVKALKSKNGWGNYVDAGSGDSKSGGGEDTYGFTALPGGYSKGGTTIENLGTEGRWWISDCPSTNTCSPIGIKSENVTNNTFSGSFTKAYLLSVRCVQD